MPKCNRRIYLLFALICYDIFVLIVILCAPAVPANQLERGERVGRGSEKDMLKNGRKLIHSKIYFPFNFQLTPLLHTEQQQQQMESRKGNLPKLLPNQNYIQNITKKPNKVFRRIFWQTKREEKIKLKNQFELSLGSSALGCITLRIRYLGI